MDYINTFLKLKVEASGYAGTVGSLSESFWKSEGIRLHKDSNKPNAAKRCLAKM